ncbi:MAG TPA: hypothetical protein VMU19_01285 [Bryobacteraceae bacterium]|nr:hypothetical protein [Bryobacteraceae bacterium]
MGAERQDAAGRRKARKAKGAGGAVEPPSRLETLKAAIETDAPLLPDENRFHLDQLARQYYRRWKLVLPNGRAKVDGLILSDWRVRRLRRLEAALWIELGAEVSVVAAAERGARMLERLESRHESAERSYIRNLKALEAMEAAAGAGASRDPREPELETMDLGLWSAPEAVGQAAAEPAAPEVTSSADGEQAGCAPDEGGEAAERKGIHLVDSGKGKPE